MEYSKFTARIPKQEKNWLSDIARIGKISEAEVIRRMIQRSALEMKLAIPTPANGQMQVNQNEPVR